MANAARKALRAYRGKPLTGKKWKARMSYELGRDTYKRRISELKQNEADAKAKRQEELPALRSDCEVRRLEVRDDCARKRAAIRAEANETIDDSKQSRRDEHDTYRRNRRIDGDYIKRDSKRTSAAEKKTESDDLVRGNIDPGLRPVWDEWRTKIKGSGRRSRTEEFLQEVEENPSEVIRVQMIASGADADFAAEQAEHYADLMG